MQSQDFDTLAAGASALRRYARSRFNAEKADVLEASWPDASAVVEVAQLMERAIVGGVVRHLPRLTREQQSVLRTVHWMQSRRANPDSEPLGALVALVTDRMHAEAGAGVADAERPIATQCDDDDSWLSGRFAARGHPLRRLRIGESDWVVHERTIRNQKVLVFESWGIMRVVRQVPGDWRNLPDRELIGVSERR